MKNTLEAAHAVANLKAYNTSAVHSSEEIAAVLHDHGFEKPYVLAARIANLPEFAPNAPWIFNDLTAKIAAILQV